MLSLPITRAWIVSHNARRVYIGAALGSVSYVVLIFAIRFAMLAANVRQVPPEGILATIMRASLFLSILCVGTLWIGMWYFWFNYDTASTLKKTFWAAVLLLLVPFGPILYFCIVYLPRARRMLDVQPFIPTAG